MAKAKKQINNIVIFAVLALAGLLAAFFGFTDHEVPGLDYVKNVFSEIDDSELSIHFIDVGQGDCTLIRTPNKTILIDAGENDQGNKVVTYLQKHNIKKIDLLIGTHPHSDHIGGLDTVIDSMEIDTVMMPEIPEESIPTTKTYMDLLTAISNKNLTVTKATAGETSELDGMVVTVLGPMQAYTDLNDLSVAVRIAYKNISILLSGDAEELAEAEMVQSGSIQESTIYKAGHHGSNTSNSPDFLKAVSPQYTVISVGKDNSYGHPVPEIVKRIEDTGSAVYRTDENGSVVFKLKDGELTIQTEK